MKTDYPQVILLGNGINLAFSNNNISLNNLIENLGNDYVYCNEEIPFPLDVVLKTNDSVDVSIKEILENNEGHAALYGTINNDVQKLYIQKIFSLKFDDIITTNYSYELEAAALNKSTLKDNDLKKISKHTNSVKQVEPKFLLHSYNEVVYREHENKIWHIHGESRKPNSMILGHYYYCNLMSRYKTFFETRKNYYYSNQENGKPIYEKSWLDSFVIGDVYILGFGFNFAEYDLWWLLNRKKRERAKHGKVYFYEAYDDNEIPAKIALLKAYDVETCNLGIKKCETGEFANFYQLALDDIKNKMEKRRKEV